MADNNNYAAQIDQMMQVFIDGQFALPCDLCESNPRYNHGRFCLGCYSKMIRSQSKQTAQEITYNTAAAQHKRVQSRKTISITNQAIADAKITKTAAKTARQARQHGIAVAQLNHLLGAGNNNGAFPLINPPGNHQPDDQMAH